MKLFNYTGNKQKLSKIINGLIQRRFYTNYYEPFLGSGAIFYNLENSFDKYILNDLNPNICLMHNFIKDNLEPKFREIEQYVFNTFGDVKNTKENWYSFRNWYNKNIHFSNNDAKGAFLIILMNSTINGIMQFGKSGYNSSFGNRYYKIPSSEYVLMNLKLQKAIILNVDYRSVEIKDNSLIFLDPPYSKSLTGYRGFEKNISLDEINKFIENYKFNDIVYTNANVDSSILQKNYFRTIKKTSPKTKIISNVDEYYFTNI